MKKKRLTIMLCLSLILLIMPSVDIMAEESQNEENIDSTEYPEYQTNYIDTGERVEYYVPIEGTEMPLVNDVAIPVSYDSRTYGCITETKNQGSYGTCWSFAAMSASEASMISQGLYDDIDLSEFQFAYFFYNCVSDPLGLIKNDKASVLNSSSYLDVGGNNAYSLFALASWKGVVEENIAPYSIVEENEYATIDSQYAFANDIAHMQNAYIVSMQNTDDIKRLIMEYGGVASSMNMIFSSNYYNSTTGAYCQKITSGQNHAITVIGWDDTYEVSNYSTLGSGNIPTNPGAWLVKNSYGSYMEYMWISYEDMCLSTSDAFAFVYESADNYDYNYQYDGMYGTCYGTLYNGGYLANVYTVQGSSAQTIDAVSIALADDNIQYSVQIYLNPEEGNPASGTPLLTAPQTGSTSYSGYYTIELDEAPIVYGGDVFSVVFTLNDLDEEGTLGTVSYYVDGDISGTDIKFDSYAESKQSYVCYFGEVDDVTTFSGVEDVCVRIKAFTNEIDGNLSAENFNVSDIETQYYTGGQITPKPLVKYGNTILTEGKHYSLSYANNIDLGKATVTITGKGIYTGNKSIDFEILGKKNPVTVYNGIDYSSVYDYNYYVKNNKDIWNAYKNDDVSVLKHFVEVGMSELRQGSEEFDVNSYYLQYPDLRQVYRKSWVQYYIHYIVCGQKEGRVGTGTTTLQNPVTVYNGVDYSAVYNYNDYMSYHSDIKSIFANDDIGALEHFVMYGMKEGRKAKSTFDPVSYRRANLDLRRIFGYNWDLYYMHYLMYGKNEGRVVTNVNKITTPITTYMGIDYSDVYDFEFYINQNPDIKKLYGDDDIKALEHFVNYGMIEGRQGSAEFEVQSYKNAHADLRGVFGYDLKQYYIHYIVAGKKEGRVATDVTELCGSTTVYQGVDYSAVYNFDEYKKYNSDIDTLFADDDIGAIKHFVEFGMSEGRQASSKFNVNQYKKKNSDLQNAFKDNLTAYYYHYIITGVYEGRVSK